MVNFNKLNQCGWEACAPTLDYKVFMYDLKEKMLNPVLSKPMRDGERMSENTPLPLL